MSTTDDFDERAEKARSRANHPAGRARPSKVGDEAEAYLAALAMGEQPYDDAPAEPAVDLGEHHRRAEAEQVYDHQDRIEKAKRTPISRILFGLVVFCAIVVVTNTYQWMTGNQEATGSTGLFAVLIGLVLWSVRRFLIVSAAEPDDSTEGGM